MSLSLLPQDFDDNERELRHSLTRFELIASEQANLWLLLSWVKPTPLAGRLQAESREGAREQYPVACPCSPYVGFRQTQFRRNNSATNQAYAEIRRFPPVHTKYIFMYEIFPNWLHDRVQGGVDRLTLDVHMYACWAVDRQSRGIPFLICKSTSTSRVLSKNEEGLIDLKSLGEDVPPNNATSEGWNQSAARHL